MSIRSIVTRTFPRILAAAFAAVIASSLFVSPFAMAQEEEIPQPGKEHKRMAKYAGKWNIESKTFFPGAPEPVASKGSADIKVLLGGRYIQQRFKGEFNGMPFEGIGTSGYDTVSEQHVGTWIDSFSTGIMRTTGEYDEKSNTLTEIGVMSAPEGGESKMKMVTKYISDDEFAFTMYMLMPDGMEMKLMEMSYKRAAKKQKNKEKANEKTSDDA